MPIKAHISKQHKLELRKVPNVQTAAIRDVMLLGQFTAEPGEKFSELKKVEEAPKRLVRPFPTQIEKKEPLPYLFNNIHYLQPFGVCDIDTTLCDIVTSRGVMKNIMRYFNTPRDQHHLEDIEYKVDVNADSGHVHIESTKEYDMKPSYGHGFVWKMVSRSDVNLYRCLSYTLGENNTTCVKVLLHVEVDCVNDDKESVELKTHDLQYAPPIPDYWYHLVLGDTRHLIVGAVDKGSGRVRSVSEHNIAGIAPENANVLLNQLAYVLRWVVDNMKGARKGTLKMGKDDSVMTLTILN